MLGIEEYIFFDEDWKVLDEIGYGDDEPAEQHAKYLCGKLQKNIIVCKKILVWENNNDISTRREEKGIN
jgi:hypothetical protein